MITGFASYAYLYRYHICLSAFLTSLSCCGKQYFLDNGFGPGNENRSAAGLDYDSGQLKKVNTRDAKTEHPFLVKGV